MAITFVGFTDTGNAFSPANAVKPTGTTSGDKIIAFLMVAASATATLGAPAGWTQIGATATDAGPGRTYGMFYSDTAAASAGPYAFTDTSGTASFQVVLLTYRGAATGALDKQNSQNNTSQTTMPNSGVTPTASGETLIHCGWNSGASVTAVSTNYTQRANNLIGQTYVQDRINAPSGATGTVGPTIGSGQLSETWMLALALPATPKQSGVSRVTQAVARSAVR